MNGYPSMIIYEKNSCLLPAVAYASFVPLPASYGGEFSVGMICTLLNTTAALYFSLRLRRDAGMDTGFFS